ncbi:MAG: hypothetical protein LBR77_07300 [Lachnospiraceae bacterium]|jgi:DNA-directed RNA polymerase specialized sigma24 family protein|nr:hypothetical protein [Lachnospiraceae bacterium]
MNNDGYEAYLKGMRQSLPFSEGELEALLVFLYENGAAAGRPGPGDAITYGLDGVGALPGDGGATDGGLHRDDGLPRDDGLRRDDGLHRGAAPAAVREARERVVAGCQPKVAEIVGEFAGMGIHGDDLVQEANLALMAAVNLCHRAPAPMDAEAFLAAVEAEIRLTLGALTDAERQRATDEEELVAKANVLEIVSQKLAQELDRHPSVGEIATKMNLPEDEVRALLEWSLAALNVESLGGFKF